jgi:hypothetical protein
MAMFHLLDESLEEFLRTAVPLPAREIDISFAAPDKDWAAKVSRPTINLYLWDVRRNLADGELGMVEVREPNGRLSRRPPLPRVDCRYLVTAWTADVRDEHSLLGAVLVELLRHSELERRYLKGAYQDIEPIPAIEIGAGDGRDNSDFWSALGGQFKPGLDVTVTATVDATLLTPAGPPVDRLIITTNTTTGDGTADARTHVGGRSEQPEGTIVSTDRGATTVGPDGTFLVPGEPGDEVRVDGAVIGRVEDQGPV